MLEAVVFTYGMLTSFVLAGTARNRRQRRRNPRMLEWVGYVLCGSLTAISAALLAYAAAAVLGLI